MASCRDIRRAFSDTIRQSGFQLPVCLSGVAVVLGDPT
jgi:hypothetical protein